MFNKQHNANGKECIRRKQNIAKDKSCIRLNIELNGFKVKAVLDTGSPVSIISIKHTQRINPVNYRELNNTANYTDFKGNAVKLTAEFEINTKYEDKTLTTA